MLDLAPEQASGKVADRRCDIWAFGAGAAGEGHGSVLALLLYVPVDPR